MITANNLIINGGNFNHHNNVPQEAPQAVMAREDMKVARTQASYSFDKLADKAFPLAFHLADADRSHSTCFPNTRLKILERIRAWALRSAEKDKFIMWLHGAAGGGKTSIARTFANWCDKDQGILLAEFFFSRADGIANQFASFAPTLAFRMAVHTLKDAKDEISNAITQDPHLFSAPLAHQFKKLVLEPLDFLIPNGITPYVIILDGLDETLTSDEQETVLNVISTTVFQHNPNLRILVCSRPEPAIVTAFNDDDSCLKDISIKISLNDDDDSDADIRIFLLEKFAKIKKQLPYPPKEEWPTPANINYLVAKSSRQFIFAATVEKYVGSSKHKHLAITRLKHVLDLSLVQGPTKSPFADLDALYLLILLTRSDDKLSATAMAICIQYPEYFGLISPEKLAIVLRIDIDEVFAILYELGSLLDVGKDHIRLFHASFGDFLYDESRSQKVCCVRGHIAADILYSRIANTPKREVPSYYIFYRLLRDATPRHDISTVLVRMAQEPRLIFGSYSYYNRDEGSYYVIPILKQLKHHISGGPYQLFLEYCQKSILQILHYGGWTYHTFPHPRQWSSIRRERQDPEMRDDCDSSTDSIHTAFNEGDDSDFDDSDFDTRQPKRAKMFSKKLTTPYLALLIDSSSWEKVHKHIDILSKGPEVLRGLYDDAHFTRSHLPSIMAYIRRGASQTRASMFCLHQMISDEIDKDVRAKFESLLPSSLSRADTSPDLTTCIWEYLTHPGITSSGIRSETEEAIINYLKTLRPSLLARFPIASALSFLSQSQPGRIWISNASASEDFFVDPVSITSAQVDNKHRTLSSTKRNNQPQARAQPVRRLFLSTSSPVQGSKKTGGHIPRGSKKLPTLPLTPVNVSASWSTARTTISSQLLLGEENLSARTKSPPTKYSNISELLQATRILPPAISTDESERSHMATSTDSSLNIQHRRNRKKEKKGKGKKNDPLHTYRTVGIYD